MMMFGGSSSVVKLESSTSTAEQQQQYGSLPNIEMMSMKQEPQQVAMSSTSLTGSNLDAADTMANVGGAVNTDLASSAAAASFSAFYNQFLIMNLLQQQLKSRVEAGLSNSGVKRKTHLSNCFMQV